MKAKHTGEDRVLIADTLNRQLTTQQAEDHQGSWSMYLPRIMDIQKETSIQKRFICNSDHMHNQKSVEGKHTCKYKAFIVDIYNITYYECVLGLKLR